MSAKLPQSVRDEIATRARAGKSDQDIATSLQLHASTVKRFRLAAGVLKGTRADAVSPTPEQIAELHTTSDRGMTKRYGHNHKTWAVIRAREGIARFRAPTTGKNKPPRVERPPMFRPVKARERGTPYGLSIARPRDHSVASEAADYLRRERWVVVNRQKVHGKDGWDVGRMCLSEAELVSMAVRKGFVVEKWMSA